VYINSTWRLHCAHSRNAYSVFWTSSDLLLYFCKPPSVLHLFSHSIQCVCYNTIFIHVCNVFWASSPTSTLSFLVLLPQIPQTASFLHHVPLLLLCCYHHHHHFRSRVHIRLFEIVLSCPMWWSLVPFIFLQRA
jgi:hypothetical protein